MDIVDCVDGIYADADEKEWAKWQAHLAWAKSLDLPTITADFVATTRLLTAGLRVEDYESEHSQECIWKWYRLLSREKTHIHKVLESAGVKEPEGLCTATVIYHVLKDGLESNHSDFLFRDYKLVNPKSRDSEERWEVISFATDLGHHAHQIVDKLAPMIRQIKAAVLDGIDWEALEVADDIDPEFRHPGIGEWVRLMYQSAAHDRFELSR